eukprot:13287340-Alexandrium_andersonii.AAC.1
MSASQVRRDPLPVLPDPDELAFLVLTVTGWLSWRPRLRIAGIGSNLRPNDPHTRGDRAPLRWPSAAEHAASSSLHVSSVRAAPMGRS